MSEQRRTPGPAATPIGNLVDVHYAQTGASGKHRRIRDA